MLPTFTQLEANYPMDEHNALFIDVLGGGFAQLVDKDDYRNTCAIRMSVAFNRCGAPIPKSLADKDGGHRDGKGNFILIHVATMKSFLESLYGDASWGMSKNPGTILDFGTIPHWKGVLAYDAGFSGATGHVDLWTGDSCHNHCPDPDVALAYGISLWKLA